MFAEFSSNQLPAKLPLEARLFKASLFESGRIASVMLDWAQAFDYLVSTFSTFDSGPA